MNRSVNPAGTQREGNVVSSLKRHECESTLMQRCLNDVCLFDIYIVYISRNFSADQWRMYIVGLLKLHDCCQEQPRKQRWPQPSHLGNNNNKRRNNTYFFVSASIIDIFVLRTAKQQMKVYRLKLGNNRSQRSTGFFILFYFFCVYIFRRKNVACNIFLRVTYVRDWILGIGRVMFRLRICEYSVRNTIQRSVCIYTTEISLDLNIF